MMRFVAVILLVSGILIPVASPQSEAAPNAWMKEPTEIGARDEVSVPIRNIRNNYFDGSPFASKGPLTLENVGRFALFAGKSSGRAPEIPDLPLRALLIGTFESHRSVMTPSHRAIYTEVTVKCSYIFEDGGGGARLGSPISILFLGGTVEDANGDVLSFLTQPKHYFIEPAKTYLLVLSYHSDGDFYPWERAGTYRTGSSELATPLKTRG
ncbi:MAG: hypothetical protein ABSF22_15450 [Bryobacteraceae bacterium]